MLITIVLLCSTIAPGCISEDEKQAKEPHSLLVYCGAGMRKPMDEIGSLFEDKYGITMTYNYAGSNTLLSQMELTKNGDVYMPGAAMYLDIAREKGFVDYEQHVVYHIPAIAVPKGDPAGITTLTDLAKPGVKVMLGDPKAAAIGRLSKRLLENNGIYDAVEKNVIARGATVNELIVHVSMGTVDASIIWTDLVTNNEKIDVVEIPRDQNIIKVVPIGTLAFSANKDAARKFVDFVASAEGKAIFEKHGFTAYPDKRYED